MAFRPSPNMMLRLILVDFILLLILSLVYYSDAFSIAPKSPSRSINLLATAAATNTANTDTKTDSSSCYWKSPETGKWVERINVQDLEVGQKLTGVVVQELLHGKTGPKLFMDCGVGRLDKRDEWQMQTAMLRLGGPNMKPSVATKKFTKLKKRKGGVELYVSRIFQESSRLEVVTNMEELQKYTNRPKLISASTLKPGQELIGTVVRLENYGCLVNVGANRHGLLHIQRVANLFGQYIDGIAGLEQAGLERGARIKLQVVSNQGKRLLLDFAQDVVDAQPERFDIKSVQPNDEFVGTVARLEPYGAMVDIGASRNGLLHIQRVADLYDQYIDKKRGLKSVGLDVGSQIRVRVVSNDDERGVFFDFTDTVKEEMEETGEEEPPTAADSTTTTTEKQPTASYSISDDEAAAWAAYAAAGDGDKQQDEKEDKAPDDYDEERDIEDQLGLGMY